MSYLDFKTPHAEVSEHCVPITFSAGKSRSPPSRSARATELIWGLSEFSVGVIQQQKYFFPATSGDKVENRASQGMSTLLIKV